MEDDKLDACYPTAILEDFFRSSETETTSSDSEESHLTPKKPGFFELIRTRSMRSLPKLHPLSVLKLSRRERGRSRRESGGDMAIVDDDSCCSKSQWKKNFTLSELQIATKNFNQENLIGKGGYAEVYKGCLGSGKIVAVKRLIRGTVEERIGDFLSEIGIMAHVDHPNTAKLIGYGVEGGMHLVLEFLPHGSLASLLHGLNEKIEWSIRYKVALGTSEGLLYLHEGCKRRIIHRDIKAANILLTKDFEPQICDFGLAKWLPEQWTQHVVSNFEGTFGYLAPEYLMHGIVDEKTDVFAFGVLLLELITRRRALDYSQQSLVMWAKPLIYKNKIRELVDPSLAGAYDTQQMNLMLLAASLCIKQSSIRRPQMSQVVQILRGNLGCLEDMKIRRMPFLRKLFEKQLFDGEDYSLIEDSNRLHQLKKLAFEV